MTAAIQETSRAAYSAILRGYALNDRQREVFEALKALEPACNLDIVDATGIPTNVVTPRMLELRKKGRVVESHRDTSRTGRTAIYWKTA